MSQSISRARRRVSDPALQIILFEPEIPANTGNIARLCAAAELPLHLIHPLGFKTDDRHLKRAGLDYWSEVDVREHLDFAAFLKFWQAPETCAAAGQKAAALFALSARAATPYNRIAACPRGSGLLFGPETRGLPESITSATPTFTIPMTGKVRSLNLATAVGIVSYHLLERLGLF
ncbi:MAG: tRNA (cytidine(34)-2'-O)-methyltransferase [Deltaproteobacteria bacterium]|nr:tRNA (cytidine(34)-2'-O)-methyltransferase [Deltaproteobacteria bacterium]